MPTTRAFAASAATSPLAAATIERRDPTPTDIEIEILFCGVCHSDLHQARGEWPGTTYPCVPGHEIVGRVSRVGSGVTKCKVGDMAAVGCMVDSCRTCDSCKRGLEQYCHAFPVLTYNGPDRHSGGHTFGGYSERIVVDEAFTLKVPAGLNLAATAPLLCAGITTYSPMRHWKVGPGQRVGVVGLGGLGHMAVKFARAFGAHVTLFTTSAKKRDDALRLGAHEVVLSTDAAAMQRGMSSFDFILDTVSGDHDINAYLQQIKLDGTLTLVGAPSNPLQVGAFNMLLPRRNFAGSAIGGIAETQEMLEFCAKNGIVSDIEIIPIQEINTAWERMVKGDVKYRFVIDMASIRKG
jgi:uncharacterized zinc-type alcohol dehydrogenase-like protein